MDATSRIRRVAQRNDELAQFLRHARARVISSASTESRTKRRTPGLRREEVAERAGISDAYYRLIERGLGGRVSSDVLTAIATALELSPADSVRLFSLSEPRVKAFERALAASNLESLGQLSLSLVGCAQPEVLAASWIEQQAGTDSLAFIYAGTAATGWKAIATSGVHAPRLLGQVQQNDDVLPLSNDDDCVQEVDLRRSPIAVHRKRAREFGTLSYVAVPIRRARGDRFVIGYALSSVHHYERSEILALRIVGAFLGYADMIRG